MIGSEVRRIGCGQQIEKELTVSVVPEDRDAVVPSRHHMVQRTGVLNSRLSRHRNAEASSVTAADGGTPRIGVSNLLGMEEIGSN